MTLPTSINPAVYLEPLRITVRSGLSLAKMLLRAVPGAADPVVLAAAKDLRAAVVELDDEWKARRAGGRAKDVRPLDARLDRAWETIESSLDRYRMLAPSHANRRRAAQLHERLFSEGLGFLVLRYVEQHAQSQRRIVLIEDEGLREDLERLVGKDFVDELHAAHDAYGDALGIDETGGGADDVDALFVLLRAVERAIGGYALQVLAYASADPEHVATARRALEPIDAFRAIARRAELEGATTGDEPDADDVVLPAGAMAPEADVPELPQG